MKNFKERITNAVKESGIDAGEEYGWILNTISNGLIRASRKRALAVRPGQSIWLREPVFRSGYACRDASGIKFECC